MKSTRTKSAILLIMLCLVMVIAAGCGNKPNNNNASSNNGSSGSAPGEGAAPTEGVPSATASHPLVTIEMEDGDIIQAELYPEVAPNTVNNFISLIQKDFMITLYSIE